MLLIGKVVGGDGALFHNSSLPKAFYYGKACYILLSHAKPCLTISFCLAPVCSQLCPNTEDTTART